MNQVPHLPSTSIPAIMAPTISIFTPLLLAHKSTILSIPKHTCSYGPHSRQKLDLYPAVSSTPSITTTTPSPILIFLPGGGFTRGDRTHPAYPEGLVFHNLGAFFAKKGFDTLVVDYRRVDDEAAGTGEGAVYPSGGEDVEEVLSWVDREYEEIKEWITSSGVPSASASAPLAENEETREKADNSNTNHSTPIFLLGNSAGGVHALTYLLDDRFAEERKKLVLSRNKYNLAGTILLSVPYNLRSLDPARGRAVVETYYPDSLLGAATRWVEKLISGSGTTAVTAADVFCPESLLLSLHDRLGNDRGASRVNGPRDQGIPKILVLDGEYDPEEEIVKTRREFVEVWRETFGDDSGGRRDLEVRELKGHNHFSTIAALMSGEREGEAWAEEVVEWMRRLMGNEI